MQPQSIDVSLAQFDAAMQVIYSVLTPTPQINWPLLSERCGTPVWVKHENHLPTGSFKVRGGLLFAEQLPPGGAVVAATRGNHGQSVAFAAQRRDITTHIVVPHGNDPDKNRAMRAYGAEVIEHGEDFDAALAFAKVLSAERGFTLFPSFSTTLIAGVGTYGIEFLRAVKALDTVYVPIGLGSGICGLIAARDALGLDTKIVGVVASAADAYARSFRQRELCTTTSANTMADGLAVRVPDAGALQAMLAGVERVVSVTDEEIMHAMRAYFSDTHNVTEGAGAAPLAALLQEKQRYNGAPVGLVLSGNNIDRARFARILDVDDI